MVEICAEALTMQPQRVPYLLPIDGQLRPQQVTLTATGEQALALGLNR